MKTAKIKREVEGAIDPLQPGRVPDKQLYLNARLTSLLPCELDGARGEIHPRHLPVGIRQSDDVRTGATADIDGAARFMILDEVEELGWTDSCIPWRLPKIPVLEKEAADQVLHVGDRC